VATATFPYLGVAETVKKGPASRDPSLIDTTRPEDDAFKEARLHGVLRSFVSSLDDLLISRAKTAVNER
jgi:hypothetical protein